MNKFNTAILLMTIMNAHSPMFAMEEEFKDIEEYFPGFTTIDTKLLHKIAKQAPDNFGRCGEIQRWHVIRWDHWSSNCNDLESVDHVKINPAPLSFALSINKSTFSYDALVDSRSTLDETKLLEVVSQNIKNGKPVMAYYRNELNILLTTIVGFDAHTGQILMLNNEGDGRKRFVEVKIDSFVIAMNLAPLFLSEDYAKYSYLKAIFEKNLAWLPFTFIVFEEKAQKKLAKVNPLANIVTEKRSQDLIIHSSGEFGKSPRGWFSSISTCLLQ